MGTGTREKTGAVARWNARSQPGPRGSRFSHRAVASFGTTRCGAGQPTPKSSVRIGLACLEQACLVGGVAAALLAHEKARAADDGLRAGVEAGAGRRRRRRRHRPTATDSRRRPRCVPARAAHRRHAPAHVTAGLDALGDDGVGSGAARCERLLHGPALVNPRPGGPASRGPPEGDDHVGLRGGREVSIARERQQEVHGHRLVAQPAHRGDLLAQVIRSEDADRAQTARGGDRCCQLVSRQAAAHAGLHHRQRHTEALPQEVHA